MPEITDITAISVVVARMIPSSVRKLRSLLPRSEWRAPFTASQNDAWEFIYLSLRRFQRRFLSNRSADPLHYHRIRPQPVRLAADESQMAAVLRGHNLNPRIGAHCRRFVGRERHE